MITIYLITNNKNTKKYIGQTTTSLKDRFSRHCCPSKTSKQLIVKAIKKYGKENFKIYEIDYIENDDLEEANRKEVFWGLFYNAIFPTGYSLKLGGRKYAHTSEETKRKISKSNTGKKFTAEGLKNLSNAHKGFKVTDETKKKLSLIFKGKKAHPNTINATKIKTCHKYLVLTPTGDKIIVINMRQFCKENNLFASNMSETLKKQKPYKGWQIIEDYGSMSKELGSRRKPLIV